MEIEVGKTYKLKDMLSSDAHWVDEGALVIARYISGEEVCIELSVAETNSDDKLWICLKDNLTEA